MKRVFLSALCALMGASLAVGSARASVGNATKNDDKSPVLRVALAGEPGSPYEVVVGESIVIASGTVPESGLEEVVLETSSATLELLAALPLSVIQPPPSGQQNLVAAMPGNAIYVPIPDAVGNPVDDDTARGPGGRGYLCAQGRGVIGKLEIRDCFGRLVALHVVAAGPQGAPRCKFFTIPWNACRACLSATRFGKTCGKKCARIGRTIRVVCSGGSKREAGLAKR